MNIVVFGAGSLGSLVGGLLATEHDVTLVGRDPHIRAIRENGLEISGDIETSVRPTARVEPPESAELAVVCVKAFDTEAAAKALSSCDIDTCLSLQNGLGNEEILAERLAASVLAGTCTYGAIQQSPGEIRCTGIGRVVVGPIHGGSSATGDRVGAALERAGIDTVVADDMPRRLWEKLAVNAGINPVTALARVKNGSVLDGDAKSLAMAAARETASLARREGIELSGEEAVAALSRVANSTAENRSSMLQDVTAERRTEIDSLNGYVVERAENHGIDVPVNRTLLWLVRTWEAKRGLR